MMKQKSVWSSSVKKLSTVAGLPRLALPTCWMIFAIFACLQSTWAQPVQSSTSVRFDPQAEIAGSLVVVGGGQMPDSVRDKFVSLAGGKGRAKIVVVPTASAAADQEAERESFLEAWRIYEPASLELFHRRKVAANDAEIAKVFDTATAVWFSGGDQNRLIDAYRGTTVEIAIQQVLQRGGVVGGTSAGAAIMSDLMIQGGNPEAKLGPGLAYLPGVVVDQHFSQRKRIDRLRGVLAKHPEYVGLGIDESTAIIVRKRTVDVLGQSSVTACWAKSKNKPAREDILKSGGQLDLVQIRRAAMARAAEVPFPDQQAKEPRLQSGSLVIVGGGGVPKVIAERFIELAGGKEASIIVIPTAQEDPLGVEHAEVSLLKRHGATNVTTLHTRDRKQANEAQFSSQLLQAKGVWFGGGRQWRFVDAYEGTLVEKRIRDMLTRGGVIGGSSAGASIQAEYMPRGHPLGNTVMMAEGYERGFAYLPGTAIDQHFFARKRTSDMTRLMKAYPQLLGIGIDESTALVVQGQIAEVIGKSRVGFYDYSHLPIKSDRDYTEVTAGQKYDLVKRRILD